MNDLLIAQLVFFGEEVQNGRNNCQNNRPEKGSEKPVHVESWCEKSYCFQHQCIDHKSKKTQRNKIHRNRKKLDDRFDC